MTTALLFGQYTQSASDVSTQEIKNSVKAGTAALIHEITSAKKIEPEGFQTGMTNRLLSSPLNNKKQSSVIASVLAGKSRNFGHTDAKASYNTAGVMNQDKAPVATKGVEASA